MLLRILKGNQPVIIFLIFILGILFWLPSMIHPPMVSLPLEDHPAPLQGLLEHLTKHWPRLEVILSFVFVVLLGLLVNWLNGKYYFIHERSFLPVLFVLLISSSIPEAHRSYTVLIASFFVLIALDRIFMTYGINKVCFQYFEAAFLISFASFFYTNLLLFSLVIWISASTLRPFYWREWITPLIGLLIPYVFLFGIFFLSKGEIHTLASQYPPLFVSSSWRYRPGLFEGIWLALLALLIIMSSYHMILKFTTKKVSSRKYLKIIFWIFLLCIIGYFILPVASVELLYMLSIPVAYLFTTYFLFQKPDWWDELVFLFFFLLLVALKILQFIQ
jgi:hypothetical protein